MPLNKLDNFIKNTEGRILYVSPADLDSTDSIDNQGNSLARPFKTLQRALIESARFSYVKGSDNDITEQTTILLMPGEHIVDNRPGYKISPHGTPASSAKYTPYGASQPDNSISDLTLDLNTNFDLNQPNNILYKFNSVYGGVVIPRGTSIVGLDLRKTKIRPKYVPNPTDGDITPNTAIFRITGACYFWQFSIFDGDENSTVYTDPKSAVSGKVKPTFSHHKLTCFEYADGVNVISDGLTDLDMYYAKLNRAYASSGRSIGETNDDRYPKKQRDFSKQRPEWEIVGAFGKDPISISDLISGDGVNNPSTRVTVTTTTDHNLTEGTPIKIDGVDDSVYNVSTKVIIDANDDSRTFHYLLPSEDELSKSGASANPNLSNATVQIETDTVSGASPYIFNISLRSVWGMNGMHADGSKSDGFRSMVVAQFTGISLQKDDRAFVKYNKTSRSYSSPQFAGISNGDLIAARSSATEKGKVYHLDSGAIYRNGWETTHIKASNDAILQIVSVFAIGYNKHFHTDTGGDASITNSNSNFGQLSLVSSSFKKESFGKDNNAFITHIIPPRSISTTERTLDWLRIDFDNIANSSTKLYIFGFDEEKNPPPSITQGFRVGAKDDDKLFVKIDGVDRSANIVMDISNGDISKKEYNVTEQPSNSNGSTFTIGSNNLLSEESVILISDIGDLPENVEENDVYYVIKVSDTEVKLASSRSDASNKISISAYGGSNLRLISRVSDKNSGDVGHPIQYDDNGWHIQLASGTTNTVWDSSNNQIITNPTGQSEPTFIKRISDDRSLDEKIYKLRVVIPKELQNARNPESGYIIQESSSTGLRNSQDADKFLTELTRNDYGYEKNSKLITTCNYNSGKVTVISELPHNLNVGDKIIVRNVKSSDNTVGTANSGYNGTFTVSSVENDLEFIYDSGRPAGAFTYPSLRDQTTPRFERNDTSKNIYVYRSEVIQNYVSGERDGIYHVYALSADYSTTEFPNLKYGQNVVNLYPQLDRDNLNDNPVSSKSFAVRSPLGKVVTNDPKNSITRETIDKLNSTIGFGKKVLSVTPLSGGISTITFDREHGLNSLRRIQITSGGSGYNNTDGDYYGVKLLGTGTGNTADEWKGATCKVTLSSGVVTGIDIIHGGSNYSSGEDLKLDTSIIGTPTSAADLTTISASNLISSVGNVIQFTGLGTITDSYTRISSIVSKTKVSVAQTSGDPNIISGQYGLVIGPSIACTVTSTTGLSTITASGTNSPIGLTIGNKFRLIDNDNNNVGDFIVKSRPDGIGISTVSVNVGIGTTGGFILKHGLSSNEGLSDVNDENLEKRAISLFDNVHGPLGVGITDGIDKFDITVSGGIGVSFAFPVGSYLQIDDEMMRVKDINADGEIEVLRGVFGTRAGIHSENALVSKVKTIPIEFRRPSIIRASGHTFEYLGYGPGNYSTGLPQVQDKTITEREEFLTQSQEREAGIVVYTGMNNKGDFFIGNQKKSSATGEETTFDTPIPTVTGENLSRLSSVFDEVTIKERIVVEGGVTSQTLSQFDGPVRFGGEVVFTSTPSVGAQFRVVDESTSSTISNGCAVFKGGIGIAENVNVGGKLDVTGHTNIKSIVSTGGTFDNIQIATKDDNTIDTKSGDLKLSAVLESKVAISTNAKVDGDLNVTGDITAFYSSDERLKDNITPIEDPLAKVISISGNTFEWNDKSKKRGTDTGLIAQEVEALGLPGLVVTRDNGYLAVDYHKVVPLLVEAIKELSDKIDSLEQRLNN